jgi:hypothetical protein
VSTYISTDGNVDAAMAAAQGVINDAAKEGEKYDSDGDKLSQSGPDMPEKQEHPPIHQ